MLTTITTKGRTVIISLHGNLDYEALETFPKKLPRTDPIDGVNFLLDMKDLDFVGSSGIEKFMKILTQTFGEDLTCVGVKNEFKRCFEIFSRGKNKFKYYPTLNDALNAFDSDVDLGNEFLDS